MTSLSIARTGAPEPVPERRAQALSGYGLRRALLCGIERVISRRDEINRINVFPVPDGDTGTNLAFTLSAVLQAVDAPRLASAGEVLRRAASEAIDGARGNSGAILAQFFQGVSERLGAAPRMSLADLADAVGAGHQGAREALAEPREGTILSVIGAFAAALERAAEGGVRDFAGAFAAALPRARESLQETSRTLPEMRAAGVVDAGALGFVDLLEGISAFIELGDRARGDVASAADLGEAGVDADVLHGPGAGERYCCECMVTAAPVDRLALKAALLAMPISSLVLAGTREKVRVHAHSDDPEALFEAAERFGAVTSRKADDMRAQATSAATSRSRVAIVVDSGADLPPEELERLQIHLVPVRISIGARDYLDKVSLSPHEFYREVRESPIPPRTSQPPPGDFRRLFEFLLSHHDALVYVGLSRALSGTLQAAETAASRVGKPGARVVDTRHGSAAQGLLAIDAAEAAAAGWSVERIAARIELMRSRTRLFAAVRDLSYGVRGGRAPKLALPLQRLFGFRPIVASTAKGRLGMAGVIGARRDFAEGFAARIAAKLDRSRAYRLMIGHCDCPEDAVRLRDALRAKVPRIERDWLFEAGSAIGAHAGPGALVVGVQEATPL